MCAMTGLNIQSSLPSCHLNFCSSDNDPLPSPPPREGACSRKSYLRSNNCHCERQNGASHSPRNDIENLCNTQYGGWSGTLPCNDRTSSCKTQVSGAAATLPLSLCEREQLLMSLRVIRDAGEGVIGCQEVRKARGQAGLEDRKVRRYEGRHLR